LLQIEQLKQQLKFHEQQQQVHLIQIEQQLQQTHEQQRDHLQIGQLKQPNDQVEPSADNFPFSLEESLLDLPTCYSTWSDTQ